jgi:hypothetical protein
MKITAFERTMFLCTIFAAGALAQAPATDVQQLKVKLQQLEQMMRSLQEQIAVVEQAGKLLGRRLRHRRLHRLRCPGLCCRSPILGRKHGKDR